jgi:hypothetical protein
MEDEILLQGEETLKTSQQAQDRSPYDPNAAARFPDGYTPVGSGEDHTPVEQINPGRVPELEVPTPQLDDIIPQDLYGSSGDNVTLRNITPEEAYKAYGIDITPVKTNDTSFTLDTISFGGGIIDNGVSSVDDLPKQEPTVDPPAPPVVPPVEPPVEPPLPPLPPVDPPHPPEPPTPPEPPVEPPLPPVDPPHPPEPPTPPDPPVDPPTPPEDHNNHSNNGFGNGDQDAPGGSGPHNNAENDQTPGEQGNSHQNDNPNPPSDHGNDTPGPQDPPVDPPSNNQDHPNNGFGNGDQDAPGDSGPHNNAENDQTPGEQGNSHENDSGNGGSGGGNNGWGNGDQDAPGNSLNHNNAENDQTPIGDYVDRYVAEHPGDNWHENIPDEFHGDQHIDNSYDVIDDFGSHNYDHSAYDDHNYHYDDASFHHGVGFDS